MESVEYGGGGESGWEQEGEGEGGESTTILSKSPKAARKIINAHVTIS